MKFRILTASLCAGISAAHAQNPSSAERFATPSEALIAAESAFWQKISLPIPEGIVLEVSGMLAVGKRLLITTRRGEIWWVDGAYDKNPQPRFTLFVAGLHEPLGLAAVPGKSDAYYVAQRQEITRITDANGDGRADRFETVWKVPLSGSYHEYAFGPVVAPDGTLRVNLNVSFDVATQSPVPWRGWMIEVTPDGRMTPIAAGLRSPTSLIRTSQGAWFYSENQGEWVASGHVAHIESGDFVGHPASLAWSQLTGSPVKLRVQDIPDDGRPLHVQARNIPGIKPPAVWFPHTIMGISTSDIREDLTKGTFGPYAGQFFVGDQGQSKVMRMSLEKVKGIWQGAAYHFRSGFDSGVLRMAWGEDGSLFVGQTNRGWGSVGKKTYALERLVWTGRTPNEIQQVTATPDGFSVTFTQPLDRAAASDPANFRIAGFTYKHHSRYGSSPIDRLLLPIRKVELSKDGRTVRLAAACLREGYIHEIKVQPAAGTDKFLHDTAYYTLNRLPDGRRIIPVEENETELCVAPVPIMTASAKHPTTTASDWVTNVTVLLGTQPGMKFDTQLITVKPGQRVRLVFRNDDDMLHNFVLTLPGRGQAVGAAALELGLDGMNLHYVPKSDDVLYHTALLQPGESDTIFFIAPSTSGDYDYICSFPGHAPIMNGILRVGAD